MADSQRKTANLFNLKEWAASITSVRGNGILDVTGDVISVTSNELQDAYTSPYLNVTGVYKIPVNPSTQYRLQGSMSSNGSFIVFQNGTTATWTTFGAITTAADTTFLTIRFGVKSTEPLGSTAKFENFMISEGASLKEYEPYWLHSLRKLTTATEAVENPLYSDGTAITAYTIKGNTVQNGTPTPTTPVDVNGVGVRTENLLDMSTVSVGYHLDITTGLPVGFGNSRMATMSPIDVSQFSAITLAYTSVGDTIQFMYSKFDGTDTLIERVAGKASGDSIDVSSAAKLYICFYRNAALTKNSVEEAMLNDGVTPQSYEPYGYKIPILSGQQTTNIYLGSTQTVRQIYKLVLTGDETGWIEAARSRGYRFNLPIISAMQSDTTVGVRSMCTHQTLVGTGETYIRNDAYTITANSELIMTLGEDTRLASWKSWLAAQYANGTPVTVLYVLTTPETAAVNEPLMKIGDYADTLSNATAIPTTEGANSITVDTTVQPSEFTATWTGWHDANVKEWDGSDWQ